MYGSSLPPRAKLRGDIEQGRFREDHVSPPQCGAASCPPASPSAAKIFPNSPAISSRALPACRASARRIIGEDALAALQAADWPGNVRQLRNVIERILILATGDPLTPVTVDALPPEAWPSAGFSKHDGLQEVIGLPLRDGTRAFRARNISTCRSRASAATFRRTAAFIGMERSALHRKLKSLGVDAPGRNGAELE